MNVNKLISFLVNRWRLLLLLLIGLIIFLWFLGHGFASINTSGSASNEDITYQLVSHKNGKSSSTITKSTKITKMLGRGSYDVIVRSRGKNYFAVMRVGGFLTRTKIAAEITGEKSRDYVGNGPAACTFYTSSTLYSYDCAGSSLVNTHLPATASTPTYAVKTDPKFGIIKGLVHTKDGTVVIGTALLDTGEPAPYKAFLLDSGLTFKNAGELSGLDANASYSFVAYKSGFIAYNNTSPAVQYFTSVSSKPETLGKKWPAITGLTLDDVSAHGDLVVASYSNSQEANKQNNNTYGSPYAAAEGTLRAARVKKVKPSTKILIYKNGEIEQFSFSKFLTYVKACGNGRLCTLDANSKQPLSVYDISGGKLKLLYNTAGGKALETTEGRLLIIRDNDIVGLDVEKRSGSIEYSFGSFRYCGISTDRNSYEVCMIDNSAHTFALRIDQSKTNTDSIDKLIGQLQSIKEVGAVSLYGKQLFITPKLTDMIYDADARGFVYDPAQKAAALKAINAKIDQLKIDRNTYAIHGLTP